MLLVAPSPCFSKLLKRIMYKIVSNYCKKGFCFQISSSSSKKDILIQLQITPTHQHWSVVTPIFMEFTRQTKKISNQNHLGKFQPFRYANFIVYNLVNIEPKNTPLRPISRLVLITFSRKVSLLIWTYQSTSENQ